MAFLFTLPRSNQFDAVGQLMSGWTVEFYSTGTSTPRTVYADQDLSTALGTSVQAGDDGSLKPIYLDESGAAYRILIKDANGEIVPNGTIDPYYAGPTQRQIGRVLYPSTSAETLAEATLANDVVASHATTGVVYASRYGFSSSATAATNTLALQKAADVCLQARSLRTYSSDGYGANTHSLPEIRLGEGVFNINAAIQLPPAVIIRGNKTILVQNTSGQDHFSFSNPYRVDIEGVSFKDGRSAIRGSGPNTNTSRIRLSRCEFHTANASEYAVSISVTTLNLLIDDCWVMDSPLFVDTDGDYIEINSCWVNGYKQSTGSKPENTASINHRGRYMRIRGGSWVPQVQGATTAANTRWINNRGGLLVLEDVQFGAENSGLPIVYEYGNSVSSGSPYSTQSGVIIRGCQLAQGTFSRTDRGVVVLQGAVPSIIDIRGGSLVTDGKIISDAGFTSPTLAEWLASNVGALTPRFGIVIENIGEHGSTFIPEPLRPYAHILQRSIGTHPGSNALGAINTPIIEYLPHTGNTQARVLSAVSGRNGSPSSSTYFNAITVTKAANEATGTATAVIVVDAVASGEVSGPTGFVSQAQFRITLLASRSGNIRSVVETVTENNLDSSGGTSVGDVLTCQVTGTSTTTVTIQLRINTTITAGAVVWNARLVSVASALSGSNGLVFSMASA